MSPACHSKGPLPQYWPYRYLLLKIYFRECNRYFSNMQLWGLYIVAKFQIHSYYTFRDMNYYPVTDGQTDGQKAMHMSPPCNMHRWAKKWVSYQKKDIAYCAPLERKRKVLHTRIWNDTSVPCSMYVLPRWCLHVIPYTPIIVDTRLDSRLVKTLFITLSNVHILTMNHHNVTMSPANVSHEKTYANHLRRLQFDTTWHEGFTKVSL